MLKFELNGIEKDYLPLFTDCMSFRKQDVNVDGYYSVTRNITFGVPQDSILGPVLFLVFINVLPSAPRSTVTDISADDTTISYSTDHKVAPQALSDGLESDLDRLQKVVR